jgi:hypothetical protein
MLYGRSYDVGHRLAQVGPFSQAPDAKAPCDCDSPLFYDRRMTKPELLRALQTEIHRHTFDYYVENPPSMAEGGKGVVVPGCPACRRRNAVTQNAFRSGLVRGAFPPATNATVAGALVYFSYTTADQFSSAPHDKVVRLVLPSKNGLAPSPETPENHSPPNPIFLLSSAVIPPSFWNRSASLC